MKVSRLLLIILTAGLFNLCISYRILGLYGLPVKSHFHWFDQLFKGLAQKGHQIDRISLFEMKENHPNYTQIINFPTSNGLKKGIEIEVLKNFARNQNLSLIAEWAYRACMNMGTPEFLNLARNPPKDPPYDVIITHMFSYHCFMILGHLWNIPVVLVSTSSMYPWMHDMIGNPENIAISPNNLIPIPEGKSFRTRFWNTYYFYLSKLSFLRDSTNQNELLEKYFGPNVPSIRELERSVSLVLMNTYFPINGVKPMTTGVVEVGGLHIQNQGPDLNKDLKNWLDESKSGVVYFNLGSILRVETFPTDLVNIIFTSLKKLAPVRVLMRVEKPNELSVKIPDNVRTMPWLPQEKILQHPNIKLFVTHGGLLGTQESIYYGVPMLCLPFIADQFTNTQNYIEKKIAVTLDLFSLTQEKFDNALNEIINNSMYRENVKRLSRLFRDRPLNAMDTAAFWIEYVVRNGKDSLRSPAMDLTWWQIELLDVFAVVFLGVLMIIIVVVFFITMMISLLSSKREKVASKKKTN